MLFFTLFAQNSVLLRGSYVLIYTTFCVVNTQIM